MFAITHRQKESLRQIDRLDEGRMRERRNAMQRERGRKRERVRRQKEPAIVRERAREREKERECVSARERIVRLG